jgi:hypothetical protein
MGLIDRLASCDKEIAREIHDACGVQAGTYTKYDIHYLNILLLVVAFVALGVLIRKENKSSGRRLIQMFEWAKKRLELVVLAIALISIFLSVTVDLDNPNTREKIETAKYHIEEFFYSEVQVQDNKYLKCSSQMQSKLFDKYRGGCN